MFINVIKNLLDIVSIMARWCISKDELIKVCHRALKKNPSARG